MNSGHYTASTRNLVTGDWQFRDDHAVVAVDQYFAQRKNDGVMYTYEIVAARNDNPAAARLPVPAAG